MSLSHFSLLELEQKQDFVRRHIGPSEAEMAEMLAAIGAESLDDLMLIFLFTGLNENLSML